MAFFSTLYDKMIRRGDGDKLLWYGTKDGVFSVKSFYCYIACGNPEIFPWRGVWWSKVPTRVYFFV